MQSLSIISVNLWHVLFALANLAIIYVIVRRFLFKPVNKVLDERRAEIDGIYAKAEKASAEAEESRLNYAAAMEAAEQTANQLIMEASRDAERRGNEIESEARSRAADIRRQAETDAMLERRKAEEDIRREIADVSTRLTGKLLEREISEADHRALIDSFLQDEGTENDTDK